MISREIKKLCSTPEMIENYEQAVNSSEMWECHHRRETIFTREELIAIGEYYDRPPEELIFITRSEHLKIHFRYCKGGEERKAYGNTAFLGKKHSVASKVKIGNSLKGRKFDKQVCINRGKKISQALQNRHWWNNGVDCVRVQECPGEGWVPGRLKS